MNRTGHLTEEAGNTLPRLRFDQPYSADRLDGLSPIPRKGGHRQALSDLGLLHLGGTMDGEQGVEAIRIIDPALSIPIHYNDYEVFKSPLDDFKQAVTAAGLQERVRYLAHGETYHFQVPATRTERAA